MKTLFIFLFLAIALTNCAKEYLPCWTCHAITRESDSKSEISLINEEIIIYPGLHDEQIKELILQNTWEKQIPTDSCVLTIKKTMYCYL